MTDETKGFRESILDTLQQAAGMDYVADVEKAIGTAHVLALIHLADVLDQRPGLPPGPDADEHEVKVERPTRPPRVDVGVMRCGSQGRIAGIGASGRRESVIVGCQLAAGHDGLHVHHVEWGVTDA